MRPTRRWVARGGAAAFTAVAVVTGMQLTLTGAQAASTLTRHHSSVTNPYSPAYHHPYRHGVVPMIARQRQMDAWARSHPQPKSANDLNYGGGIDGIGVTTGHEKVYLVFYGSQWGTAGTNSSGYTTLSNDPSGEAPYLQGLFKGLGTNSELWSGVMTQYCDGVAVGAQSCPSSSTEHVAYPTGGALAGVWVDTGSATPSQASGHQLGVQAVNAAAHFGNTTAASNRDAQYDILSPTGANPDGWLTGGFCAWHDYNGDSTLSGGAVSSPYGDIAFTNMPYVTDAGTSCGQDFVNSNGTDDGMSIVNGHEYAETVTDQNPAGGYTDSSGAENGDKCAWITPGTSGGSFDLHLATGTFAMQTTWANDGSGGNGACEASHPIVSNGGGGGGYPSGYHQLVANSDSLCVDVAGASTVNNAAIVQWTCKTTGNANQEWQFNPVSGGYGELQNLNSGKDFVVQGASKTEGAKVIQYTQNGTTNGLWLPIKLSNGSWQFKNENSGFCLDITGASSSLGVQLDQWACKSSAAGSNQAFATR
ncbi:MAG TPA: RICIN domain-containing protein [Streptosporangiaceae bacterium]|nr:RICIN domain-containing protein [Streptosporangiaceae bacterium]